MSGSPSQAFYPLERTIVYVKDQICKKEEYQCEDMKPHEVSAHSPIFQCKQGIDMPDPSIRPNVSLPHKKNGNDVVSQPIDYFMAHEPLPCSRPQIS